MRSYSLVTLLDSKFNFKKRKKKKKKIDSKNLSVDLISLIKNFLLTFKKYTLLRYNLPLQNCTHFKFIFSWAMTSVWTSVTNLTVKIQNNSSNIPNFRYCSYTDLSQQLLLNFLLFSHKLLGPDSRIYTYHYYCFRNTLSQFYSTFKDFADWFLWSLFLPFYLEPHKSYERRWNCFNVGILICLLRKAVLYLIHISMSQQSFFEPEVLYFFWNSPECPLLYFVQ